MTTWYATHTRRDLLKALGAAGLATLLLPEPTEGTTESFPQVLPAPAKRLIILWMAGGMPHTDTFDPKRHQPYSPGLHSRELLSTFPSIPTTIDGISISAGLEGIASILDRGALIRSYVSAELGPALHTRHQFHWHTGYVPPQTLLMPHIGAVVAKVLGRIHPDIPAYIDIGQRLIFQGSSEVKAYMTGGFLGAEHGPLHLPLPSKAARSIAPPEAVSADRFSRRNLLFQRLANRSLLPADASAFHREAFGRSLESAYRLVHSPASAAFDLTTEPEVSARPYLQSEFGKGCLLARRLLEAGARCVEVSSEYIPFGRWDTHADGHKRTVELKKEVDTPIKQLVLDLEERGLLNETLIVLASEFSRVAGKNPGKRNRSTDYHITDPSLYGLHRHFTKAGSVLLLGAGVRRGTVYGKTSDDFPCAVVENPRTISDLHATIYRLLGIPADYHFVVEKRPVYVTEDGKGRIIEELVGT